MIVEAPGGAPVKFCALAKIPIILATIALAAVEDHRHVGDGREAELRNPLRIRLEDLDHAALAADVTRPTGARAEPVALLIETASSPQGAPTTIDLKRPGIRRIRAPCT